MINIEQDIIAVWIGTTTKTLYEFNQYSDGLDSLDFEPPILSDFNTPFIDIDFFSGYGTKDNKIVPVEDLIKELPTMSKKVDEAILATCLEKGISEGNSMYYYVDAFFVEEEPNKTYNDLTFIGNFKNL